MKHKEEDMINKLCLILAGVPLLILYIVKCIENKGWITTPLAFICIIVGGICAVTVLLRFFIVIGWMPID